MTFEQENIARWRNRTLAAEVRESELRIALRQIADRHVPDQPASSEYTELQWAYRHVRTLRRIALDAIETNKAKAAA